MIYITCRYFKGVGIWILFSNQGVKWYAGYVREKSSVNVGHVPT